MLNIATEKAIDLCLLMLELDPNKRISAVEAIENIYLKDREESHNYCYNAKS